MRLTPPTTFAGLLALVSYTKDFVFNDGMGGIRGVTRISAHLGDVDSEPGRISATGSLPEES